MTLVLLQAQLAHLTSQKRLLADLYCHVQQNTREHLQQSDSDMEVSNGSAQARLFTKPQAMASDHENGEIYDCQHSVVSEEAESCSTAR